MFSQTKTPLCNCGEKATSNWLVMKNYFEISISVCCRSLNGQVNFFLRSSLQVQNSPLLKPCLSIKLIHSTYSRNILLLYIEFVIYINFVTQSFFSGAAIASTGNLSSLLFCCCKQDTKTESVKTTQR